MDNNNPPATAGPVPVSPQPTPLQAEDNKGSNKIILWFVIGLVIVVVAVGGIYLFLSRQQAATPRTQAQTVKTQTPASTPQKSLEADLEAIDVESGADKEFTSIDQDLQQL